MAIAGLLALLLYLLFGALIGAVMLRAAIAICNKLLPNAPLNELHEPASVENHQNGTDAVVQASIQKNDNPYATPQAIQVVAPAALTLLEFRSRRMERLVGSVSLRCSSTSLSLVFNWFVRRQLWTAVECVLYPPLDHACTVSSCSNGCFEVHVANFNRPFRDGICGVRLRRVAYDVSDWNCGDGVVEARRVTNPKVKSGHRLTFR